jgi:hypothetical protein
VATLIVVEDLAGPATLNRGGQAMLLLQTLEGLRRLGHDVLFLEFVAGAGDDARRWFRDVIARWWLPDRAAMVDFGTESVLVGPSDRELKALIDRAQAVITLAAHYRREPWPLVGHIRPRVLIEQDPGYTHLWAADGDPLDIFGEHDLYFTVGGNIGTPRCDLPTLGIEWHPTWNPVVLEWWAGEAERTRDRFTTIAGWRDYGYLEFEDQILGPKTEEFRKFLDLPERAEETLEIALSAEPDDPDREVLVECGWRLEDPMVVATPEQYRDYILSSAGEFSCAKGGYVGTRSGWFSDRSAAYLAAGRPVVLQSTGFEDLLPTGEGLFAAADVDEAADAVRAIRADYRRHSDAARAIAAEHFDGARVLPPMLARAGIGHAA